MLTLQPSAGYAIRARVEVQNIPGTLGRLTSAIGRAGGNIDAIDLVEHRGSSLMREITVKCQDEEHSKTVLRHVGRVKGVRVEWVSDRTFDLHRGGKIEIASRRPLLTRDDLAMAYTPGVGRVAAAIARDPDLVWDLTIKKNSVAVLTDGTAVLGLGPVGPEAAMPVMEGKAMLFKEFAGIDAYPICVRATSTEHLIAVAEGVAPGFGGINLEDIASPRCFEVEERLQASLDIPVMHDDQHGTAVVAAAALLNAAAVVGKRLEDLTVAIVGVGAAGSAIADLLLEMGIGDLVAVDRGGILDPADRGLNARQSRIAARSNCRRRQGGAQEALEGVDALIATSRPGTVVPAWLERMGREAIVFALANPVPEIMPELMPSNVRVVATGRSDYPNQINNVLVFPGFFRGLLDSRARRVHYPMKIAAAQALAALVTQSELSEEYILPSVLDRRVAPTVAEAVRKAADPIGSDHEPIAPQEPVLNGRSSRHMG